jgi:photosystem II stability/assembly factor-like uncharacterized protein
LYACTTDYGAGTIFKTTNGGSFWIELDSDTLNSLDGGIRSISINPLNTNNIYVVAGGECDLYWTNDGGMTWFKIACIDTSLLEVVVHPTAPETVYAATSHGFYISGDSGFTWNKYNDGLTVVEQMSVHSIIVNPIKTSHIYLREFSWSKRGTEIFKSYDGGNSWQQIPYSLFGSSYNNLGIINPIITMNMPPDGSTIYIGCLTRGIYKYLLGDL